MADRTTSSTLVRLESSLTSRQLILIFLGVNLVWRLLWLPLSKGAYTDGVLQVDMVRFGLTYWPPFYGILTRLFAWMPGMGLENSGRLIALLCGTLTVVPLAVIAQRLFGLRAALLAMVAYTCSPIPLRWSLQVMSDTPFLLLWMCALACTLLAAECFWPAQFAQTEKEAPARDERKGMQWLLLASLTGALATLTRYQGIFLAPLIAMVAYRAIQPAAPTAGPGGKTPEGATAGGPGRAMPWWLTLAPWAMFPLWMLQKGPGPLMVHISQIGERSQSGSLLQTLLNYWWFFEQFVLMGPYFVTYGLFGFAAYGLFRTQYKTTRIRLSTYAAIYLMLAVLALQSVFQAYQSRYLLPLVPFFCIAAGHGMAIWQKRCIEHRWRFLALVVPALAWGLFISSAVAFYQGTPFLDIKEASLYVKSLPQVHERLGFDRDVFTTEVYNAEIPTPKVEFWTGRDRIHLIGGELQPKPGDYVILPSMYGGLGRGGWNQYQQVKRELMMLLPAKELRRFAYVSYPLFPDLMEEPGTHVNPLAWHLRYMRQNFETTVLEVVLPGEGPDPAAAETAPAETTGAGAPAF